MEKGLVSIITPCYNGAKYIGETIESVMNQTYPKWEMIIIDDGSSDNSVSVVQKYMEKESRIRLLQQANAGSAAARNHGIREAQGQYIALLDADDIWLPDFLRKQIHFMKKRNAVLAAFNSYLSNTSGPQLALPNPRVTASRETTVLAQVLNWYVCLLLSLRLV